MCMPMDQPHIPPSTHPQSTINAQCKASHECLCIEMTLLIDGSLWQIIATTNQSNNLSNTEIRVLVGEIVVRKHMLILSFT